MAYNIVSKSALLDCLIENNRFSNHKLDATQIGAEDFRNWKSMVADLHKAAYKVYEAQENHADATAPTTALFNEVKAIVAEIGNLTLVDKDGNEHPCPVTIDDNFVNCLSVLCSNYAGKIGKDKAPELQLVESQISNTRTTLKKYESINGVNPDSIEALKKTLQGFEDKKAELMDTADMCKDKPVVASPESFRKNFEHHLARVLKEQKAQSYEEYAAAKEARRKARNKRSADRKKAKAEAAKTNS